jgi:hypothetical protein
VVLLSAREPEAYEETDEVRHNFPGGRYNQLLSNVTKKRPDDESGRFVSSAEMLDGLKGLVESDSLPNSRPK